MIIHSKPQPRSAAMGSLGREALRGSICPGNADVQVLSPEKWATRPSMWSESAECPVFTRSVQVCGPCNLPHGDGTASLLSTHVSFHSCATKSLLPSVRLHQALVTPLTEPKPSLYAAEKLKCGSMHYPPSHPPGSTLSLTKQKAPYRLIPGPGDEDCEEIGWLRNWRAGLPVFQKYQLHLTLSPQRTPATWISALMGKHM